MQIDARIPLMAQGPQPDQRMNMLANVMNLIGASQKNKLAELQYSTLLEQRPLEVEAKRLELEKARLLNALASGSSGQPQAEGAETGGLRSAAAFQNALARARSIGMLDPARGRVEMDALKLEYPELKFDGGIPTHPYTGMPVQGAPIRPNVNPQGFATTPRFNAHTGQFEIGVTPGAEEAYRLQQNIQQGTQAQYETVKIWVDDGQGNRRQIDIPKSMLPQVFGQTMPTQPQPAAAQPMAAPSPAPRAPALPTDQEYLNTPEFKARPDAEQNAIRNLVRPTQAAPSPASISNVIPADRVLRPTGAPTAGEKAFSEKLEEKSADDIVKGRQGAVDSAEIINTVNEGRKILDAGAITGFGANFLVGFDQALKQAGINLGGDASTNSQTYAANMAQNVGKIIKQFGAGTGLSDADREYASAMAGGKITLNEQALRRILDINERAARNVITRHNNRVSGVQSSTPLTVDMPPAYKKQPTTFDSMPNPQNYNGRLIEDEKGTKWRSNGRTWVKQ